MMVIGVAGGVADEAISLSGWARFVACSVSKQASYPVLSCPGLLLL